MRRPYYLIRRGKSWDYRLNRESGLAESDHVTWHTTGCENWQDAESCRKDLLSTGRGPGPDTLPSPDWKSPIRECLPVGDWGLGRAQAARSGPG